MSTVADKLAKKSSSKTNAKQVRLRLVYVDFWSAVKLSFLTAVALAIVTVIAKGRNSSPTMSPTNTIGRNTATVVMVEAVIADATSRTARRIADPLSAPST